MKAKAGTLESSIESSGVREKKLMKDLENARIHRKYAKDKQANQSKHVNLWFKSLVDIAKHLTAQVATMGMEGPIFSVGEHEVPSVNMGLFFNQLIEKLKTHEEGRVDRVARESRKLAHNTLLVVLSNIAYRRLDLDHTYGFTRLPKDIYISTTKEKAAPYADKVLVIPKAPRGAMHGLEPFTSL